MRLDIACDESGWEGETLVSGNTIVLGHASVRLSTADAAECMAEVRARIRSPAEEYKANHLLRPKHRAVLLWFLGSDGPIYGRAHVQLIDQAYWLLVRLVDLVIDADADGMAFDLYRVGPRAVGRALWRRFLVAANDLLRSKSRHGIYPPVAAFYEVVDDIAAAGQHETLLPLLRSLDEIRELVPLLRARILDDPRTATLDPMVPAVAATIAYWARPGQDVTIVHDEQSALTRGRIDELKTMFNGPDGHLTEIALVDSRNDPRVQIADFLAGTARKIAEEELHGNGDDELSPQLRPYLDGTSMWPDERSWARLTTPTVSLSGH